MPTDNRWRIRLEPESLLKTLTRYLQHPTLKRLAFCIQDRRSAGRCVGERVASWFVLIR